MGIYLNPGNSGFREILNSKYVDKTKLIGLINSTIDTKQKLTCVSRPRRFGKSYAAQMLCAYYDKTCDSEELFKGRKIAGDDTFYEHLNKYDVIYIDMTYLKEFSDNYNNITLYLSQKITEELALEYPELTISNELPSTMINSVELNNNKFIAIIDEWDAPVRENPAIEKKYFEFLRTLFKSSGTTAKIFAATYMTGILPIKKDKSQSAISDFMEYTVLDPGIFTEYTGFTENEVKQLCSEFNMDFREAKAWYDGYCFSGYGSIYNPYSLMSAMRSGKFRSYWKKTSAAESLNAYINMDFEGMQEIISRLIAGEEIEVDTDYYENDFRTFKSLDDVLTLLIHLGYLSYNDDERTVRIPNEEIRTEFRGILRGVDVNDKWIELINRSKKLLENTIKGDGEAVAKAIEEIRDTEYAPSFYNNEQALRYIIKFAYIAAVDQYLKVEELPSGHGIADVVYIPKKRSRYPVLLIELKWDKSADGAIKQILGRNYPEPLKNLFDSGDYCGNIILAGINYNSRTKTHSCVIKEYSAVQCTE